LGSVSGLDDLEERTNSRPCRYSNPGPPNP